MEHVTLKVAGIKCGNCAKKVEGALESIGASCEVNVAGGTVAVKYDKSKVELNTIKEAIEGKGYTVE